MVVIMYAPKVESRITKIEASKNPIGPRIDIEIRNCITISIYLDTNVGIACVPYFVNSSIDDKVIGRIVTIIVNDHVTLFVDG